MNVISDSMSIVGMVQAVPHLLRSIPFDDSSISVLAMLAGIIGGWTLTSVHQQMKAKKVKVARKRPQGLRKPE